MRLIHHLLALTTLLAASAVAAEQRVNSPDGKLSVAVSDLPASGYSEATFSVTYNGKNVLEGAKLGMETDLQSFRKLRPLSVSEAKQHKDDYVMVSGKRTHCTNTAFERVFRFENDKQQILEVTFRAYNDGIAFRYRINAAADPENITNELTAYPIAEGSKRWIQQYDIGYERFYPLATNGKPLGDHNAGKWGYPALVEAQDGLFVLLTEADIQRGHCGSFLQNAGHLNEYQVQLADQKLPFKGSWTSPWRTLIVGSLDKVVESTLVTDVSEPSQVKDTSWIKPGPVAWIYWAHNHGSRDFKIVKEYIDLAVAMNWPYNLIDWEWDVMANGGNIEDAVKYSLSKKIKPLLWYNSSTAWAGSGAPGPLNRLNSKESREKEYAWLNQLGVAGIKVDFFPGDGVAAMDYYLDLLEDGAKFKLLLNFHGATIPRGWQRTYPNLMTMEAVYGAEWYNNNRVLTDRAAEHNATLPFTRNVVGSMDYTPGTFSDSQNPHITSHAHELALPILFESAWQHMPDRPSAYLSLPEPAKKLLSELPTVWDDTKLLAGYPGQEVVIARRKGNIWYIAGINGTPEARTLSFDLSKLPSLGRKGMIIQDGADQKSFKITQGISTRGIQEPMKIDCLPRGGFVVVIK